MAKETSPAPENNDPPSSAPSEMNVLTEFDLLLGTAWGRLEDAVREQRGLKDLRTFTVGRALHGKQGYLAQFALADNYKLSSLQSAETIRVGVPILEMDIDYPLVAKSERYLVLFRGITDEAVIIDGKNFNALQNANEPLVEELDIKLMTYEVVPLRKIAFRNLVEG